MDVLSGKLKDILVQKEKEVIQAESEGIVAEAARKMCDNKERTLIVLEREFLRSILRSGT